MDELSQFLEELRREIEGQFTGDLRNLWLQVLAQEAERVRREDADVFERCPNLPSPSLANYGIDQPGRVGAYDVAIRDEFANVKHPLTGLDES
jgi:hypothetical protein